MLGLPARGASARDRGREHWVLAPFTLREIVSARLKETADRRRRGQPRQVDGPAGMCVSGTPHVGPSLSAAALAFAFWLNFCCVRGFSHPVAKLPSRQIRRSNRSGTDASSVHGATAIRCVSLTTLQQCSLAALAAGSARAAATGPDDPEFGALGARCASFWLAKSKEGKVARDAHGPLGDMQIYKQLGAPSATRRLAARTASPALSCPSCPSSWLSLSPAAGWSPAGTVAHSG